MTRVQLVSDAEIDPSIADLAASGRADYGQLLNTWRAIMLRPPIFAAYLPFLRSVAGPGTVDARLKCLSALLVGSLNGCRYTTSHRAVAATRAGASAADLDAIARRDWSAMTPLDRLVLDVTSDLTMSPGAADDEAETRARQLQQELDDAQLVELVMSIGVWNALSRFHLFMQFDLDMDPAPAGLDPSPAGNSPARHDERTQ